ncbi:caspase family protein [Paucibacter sp. AS339]|uniref:caspase family protein n=1 Tax=Paucibacter hankyongi TaxID=3133434 RepID=UPI003099E94F
MFVYVLGLLPSLSLAAGDANVELYVESGIRHSARGVAYSLDGRLIAAGSLDRTIIVWDTVSGREVASLPNRTQSTSLAFLPGSYVVAANGEEGQVQFWDISRRAKAFPDFQCAERPSPSIAVSLGRSELLCVDGVRQAVRRWDLNTHVEIHPAYSTPGLETSSRLSSDGSAVTVVGTDRKPRLIELPSLQTLGDLPTAFGNLGAFAFQPKLGLIGAIEEGHGEVTLWTWRVDGTAGESRNLGGAQANAIAFNPTEPHLAVAQENGEIVIVNPALPKPFSRPVVRLSSLGNRIEAAGMAPDSTVMAVQAWYDTQLTYDVKRGTLVRAVVPRLSAANGEFQDTGTLENRPFRVKRLEDRVELLGADGRLIATMVFLDKTGAWVAVDPSGRFDTNMDLSNVNGVHWVVDGKPLSPLPLEILMRDYFEPRLIPRLLSGSTFATARSLNQLNRMQPDIQIESISAGPTPDQVRVRVKATGRGDTAGRGGRTAPQAFDLRLFRNGQLVKRWPGGPEVADDWDGWRKRSLVPEGTHEALVTLPTASAGGPVSFTAYAFNEDRVKSATARKDHPVPADIRKRNRRAYVLTIGVDSYQDAGRQLQFAVNDAKAMHQALSALDGYEVIGISLTSQGRIPKEWQATKANIRAVLARLAGQPVSNSLAAVKGYERLAPANPDDLVIMTFAGHGYTTPEGRFYLLASDTGQIEQPPSTKALAQFISSDELSDWLRPIDAGQMALIIDACHSAALVDQPGFKPGPMGDRGLGQLAYDKAMRILSGSQADAVALESANLKHGLLTYALVHDGFVVKDGKLAADEDRNGQLTLAEWLRWGEQQTPRLYADIQAKRRDAVSGTRDGAVDARFRTPSTGKVQTPALFDFARAANDVPIH